MLYGGQRVTGVALLTHPSSRSYSVRQPSCSYSPLWLILVLLHRMSSFERYWCPCRA